MKKFNEIFHEATSSFDKVINEIVPKEEIKVSSKYNLPKGGGLLKIKKADQKVFLDLFYNDAGTKGVGNGEVSLYWLFNFNSGKNSNRCKENRGSDQPDLIIDGMNCEVKSYPQKTGKINLGRFQDAKEFRQLLSYVFGIENLFVALDPGSKKTFSSETTFLHKNLLNSLKRVSELNDILKKNPSLVEGFSVFKNIKKNIDILNKKLGKGDYEEQAAALASLLIEYKVGRKPGDNGYMINLHANNPLDIQCHYVDFDEFRNKTTKDINKVYAVSSATLKIDFSKFS